MGAEPGREPVRAVAAVGDASGNGAGGIEPARAAEFLVVALGRAFHEAGVASDAVERTMQTIAQALGLPIQVNALPTSLTVSIGPLGAQEVFILRLQPGSVNLARLAALQAVGRAVVQRRLDPAAALARVEAIRAAPARYPAPLFVASFGCISFAIAVLLGGGWTEVAAATVSGLGGGVIALVAERVPLVARLFEVLAALLAALVVTTANGIIGPIAGYLAVAAGVGQLLPGYTLTTGVHELANRSLVAGTARIGAASLTLLLLAGGVVLAVTLGATYPGEFASPPPQPVPDWLTLPVIVVAALGFALNLNARRNDLGWLFATCALAVLLTKATAPLPGWGTGGFLSALLIGVATNLGARFLAVPSAVLLVPALYLLVPGALGYESLLTLLDEEIITGVTFAGRALITALLIVIGLLVSQLVVPPDRVAGDIL